MVEYVTFCSFQAHNKIRMDAILRIDVTSPEQLGKVNNLQEMNRISI
jgi:hypothetical protein